MKRLPTLLSCLFLLTACQKDPAMPTAASSPQPLQTSEPQTSEPQITEPRTNEEIRATAEKFLAQYRYLNAASWAYKLQQHGVTLPPHLQAVLDEMHYDPEAPSPPAASSPSVRSKSPACNPKPKTATPPPPSASPNTTAWPPDSPLKTNVWPPTGKPKPPAPAQRNKTTGKKRLPETQRSKVSAKLNFQVAFVLFNPAHSRAAGSGD